MPRTYGGVRGTKSPEEVAEESRAKRKDELVTEARDNTNLCWAIHLEPAGNIAAHWPVKHYTVAEQRNGSLWVVDSDTETCVCIYPPLMWFGMSLEHQPRIRDNDETWKQFLPHQAYLADLADRLVDEAQEGNLS